jgi:hypothetical protein
MNKNELKCIADEEIQRLKGLKQPLVRVCGPWTTGGYGKEENIRRYKEAVARLESEGKTVVDYFASDEKI